MNKKKSIIAILAVGLMALTACNSKTRKSSSVISNNDGSSNILITSNNNLSSNQKTSSSEFKVSSVNSSSNNVTASSSSNKSSSKSSAASSSSSNKSSSSSKSSSAQASSSQQSSSSSKSSSAQASSSQQSSSSSSFSSSSSELHIHILGPEIEENRVEPTCGQSGGYDTVRYCALCGEEMQRIHTDLPATGEHNSVKDPDTLEYTCSVCNTMTGRDYEMTLEANPLHVGDIYDKHGVISTVWKNDDHALSFVYIMYVIDDNYFTPWETSSVITDEYLGKEVEAHVYIGANDNTYLKTNDGTLTNCTVVYNGNSYECIDSAGGTIQSPDGTSYNQYFHFEVPFGTVLPSLATTYTVTWKNYDGTVLETDSNVSSGTMPEYNSAAPTRTTDATYAYYFKGWDKEISPVNGDITYTATYEQTRFYMSESEDGWTVTGLIESDYNGELELEETLLNKPVIAIAANALNGANNVLSFTVPDTVTSIGNQAFANMSLLVVFTANNNAGALNTIGWNIFLGCSSLVSIAIPLYGHIGTLFGTTEFGGASAVVSGGETYYIPDSLKNFKDTGGILSSKAFNGTALTTIEITDQVLLINEQALAGANYLVNVAIPYVGIEKDATEASFDTLFGVIFSKENLSGVYNSAYQGYDSSHHIYYYYPKTLKNVTANGGSFLGHEFDDIKGIETITLNNVTNIGYYSFYECDADVILSEGLETIEEHAFYYSDMDEELVIPDSVKTIGQSAFSYAKLITSFVVGENVESLGKTAFNGCKAAKSITFKGNKITEIQSRTFDGCECLEAIVVPEGVTKINSQAFDYCASLADVTLPSTLTNLKAASIFSHNEVLTTIKYNGTKAMWNAIEKASNWYSSSQCPNLTTIQCTDGNITL